MPKEPDHKLIDPAGDEKDCVCNIGEDHLEDGDTDIHGEALSGSDAEDIWLSSGKDEDYDFR